MTIDSLRNMTSNIVFIFQLSFPVPCALSLVPVWLCPAFCNLALRYCNTLF